MKAFVVMYSSTLDEDPEPMCVFFDEDEAEEYRHKENEEGEFPDGDVLGYYIREVEVKGKIG